MKYVLAIFLFFIFKVSSGQSFITYNDSANHFTIGIPVGWKYGLLKNYPSIKLMVYRTPDSSTDTSKDNFNINVLQTPDLNLDKTYFKFLKSLEVGDDFKLIQFGEIVVNGKEFKWLIETHKNKNVEIQMHNYDFLTYQNDKTYILTFSTFSNRFEAIKPIFDIILNSFFLTE